MAAKSAVSAYYAHCENFRNNVLPGLLKMTAEAGIKFKVPEDCSSNFALGDYRIESTPWVTMRMSLLFEAKAAAKKAGFANTNIGIIEYLAQCEDVVWCKHGNIIHVRKEK